MLSARSQQEAGVEDLQMEVMALQRQLAEVQGRHDSELAAQREQHAQQLSSLHAELSWATEQAHASREEHTAHIAALQKQVWQDFKDPRAKCCYAIVIIPVDSDLRRSPRYV